MSGAGPNSLLSLPNLLSLSRLPLGGLFWVTLGPTTTRGFLALGVMVWLLARGPKRSWLTAVLACALGAGIIAGHRAFPLVVADELAGLFHHCA